VNEEIDSKLSAQIDALSEEGNQLADSGQFLAAWKKFSEALNLVPEPKVEREASTWLIAAMGDMAFQLKKFDQACDAFSDAVRCPGGLGNPFVHLRKGQCHFELGVMKRAADDLTRAYMGAGREIFKRENPKYFALLERVLKPPAGENSL
jgi:tetratricopeptide (TPR) repeat protein